MKNITLEEIKNFLQNRSQSTVSDIVPVANLGEWSTAYYYKDGHNNNVIRFGVHINDFKRDEYAHNHFNSEVLPIPKILSIGSAFDGYYAISQKAEGVPIESLTRSSFEKLLPSIMDLLDGLRNADTSGTKGFGFWNAEGSGHMGSWRETLLFVDNNSKERRIYGWKENLEKRNSEMKIFENGCRFLAENIDVCPEMRALIHSDLLHSNVLADENRITAVIDWGCAKYGDFLYDVAWFVFWSAWYPQMKGIDFRKVFLQHFKDTNVLVPDYDMRIRLYEVHIALDNMTYCAYRENWDNIVGIKEKLGTII